MPKLIEMPKLSDTMQEGTLAKWLVKEGDTVTNGKAVADVETDKATMEMTSYFDGTIHKLLVKPGEKVPLSFPLAVVLEEDEAAPANLDDIIAKARAAATPAPKEEKAAASTGGAKRGAAVATPGIALPSAPGYTRRAAAGNGARVKASPLARKIADERGIDLGRLTGTGPGGRIVRFDVESAPAGGGAAAARMSA
jgi:pyruvate dehydrogenase E2 component (dihydrolipoamide acetyltransferase)